MSSALVAGDLFARVPLIFDQATWNGGWKDVQEGAAATATFNHTQYPIVVTNRGAISERWVVRTVQQGPETVAHDDFTLLIRGDVDTP